MGDIAQASGCLGRPYRLTGVVVRGRGKGHEIGTPTANLSFFSERLIPAGGVYACRTRIADLENHLAVVNIGARPTFADASGSGVVVEAHLLDFEADLYDQKLTIDFIARLRDEKAFPTVDALAAQVRDDIARARVILG